MSELEQFIEHLKAGPQVLLTGQHFFGVESQSNALFAAAGFDADANVYKDCLSEKAASTQKLLDEAGKAIDVAERYKLLRQFPWRCVYTSAIDPTPYLLKHDAQKRPVTNVFESRQPESASLTLYRLFGSTGRKASAELPPTNKSELQNRRTANAETITMLPQFVGPSGRLFVTGWHPSKKDWLRPRDIGNALNRLTKGQVLIFGLTLDDKETLDDDDDFAILIEEGKVVLFESALVDLLEQADSKGHFRIDEALLAPDTFTITIAPHTPKADKIKNLKGLGTTTPLRLSVQEHRRLSETIEILGDNVGHQPKPETEEETSLAFLQFLGRDPLMHLGDCDRFAFQRPVFKKVVAEKVFELLDSSAPQEHTIVLSGQTGAGKSIMLASLAIRLRRAGVPVILIANRLTPPNKRHIDDFLQAVDSHSSVATAILWDGLESPEEYQRMSRWAASLGKKALVVGTSYALQLSRSQKAKKSSTTILDIPIDASDEHKDLLDHFGTFLPDHRPIIEKYQSNTYQNFFELIYYLTSASRARLIAGIDAEFSAHVKSLDSHLEKRSNTNDVSSSIGSIGHALRDAYGDRFDELLSNGSAFEDDEDTKNTLGYRLIKAIMVVGSLGLHTPQSIALAMCHDGRNNDFQVYQNVFNEFPLIDAFEDHGNYFVRPRLRLEASLWSTRACPNAIDTLDVILDVAGKIKCAEARHQKKSDELEFVVKLLQTVGSEGPENYKIPQGYFKIAECVEGIQSRCGKVNPRLLLVKANSLREHVQQDQSEFRTGGRLDLSKIDVERLSGWETKLRSAEEALSEAEADLMQQLVKSSQSRGARTMLGVLSTEKAATIGGQLICLGASLRIRSQPDDFEKVSATLNRARNAWRRSLTIDEENARAIDTACWITRNLLEECPISIEEKYEMLAEWNELIVRYEELDLSPHQLDKFEVREAQFANALGDRNRLEEVLARSTERGNYAIHALIARGIAAEEGGAQKALQYLTENCKDHLLTERTLLLLYYRLWWRLNSDLGGFFIPEEIVLPFSSSKWQKLLGLAKSRLSFEGESENQLAIFHTAWSCLQLGYSKDAQEYLRLLDTLSVGNFRRGRALALLSNSDGKPQEFTGEARSGTFAHKGKVWIEDLRLEVPYMTAQFPDAAGGTLSGFHIALNYRGAFVQPSSVYRNKKARKKQEEAKNKKQEKRKG